MSSRRTALARRVVADAARAHLQKTRGVPMGMGGSGLPFARDASEADGYAMNVMSLDRIPAGRAVKIGPHTFDAKSLRALLAANPGATNPLTREPLPARVVKRYGPRRPTAPPGRKSPYIAASRTETQGRMNVALRFSGFGGNTFETWIVAGPRFTPTVLHRIAMSILSPGSYAGEIVMATGGRATRTSRGPTLLRPTSSSTLESMGLFRPGGSLTIKVRPRTARPSITA